MLRWWVAEVAGLGSWQVRWAPPALGYGCSSPLETRPALHCTALHCTALHCTALHCTALHCTALYHTAALHCTALTYNEMVLYCIVYNGAN